MINCKLFLILDFPYIHSNLYQSNFMKKKVIYYRNITNVRQSSKDSKQHNLLNQSNYKTSIKTFKARHSASSRNRSLPYGAISDGSQ